MKLKMVVLMFIFIGVSGCKNSTPQGVMGKAYQAITAENSLAKFESTLTKKAQQNWGSEQTVILLRKFADPNKFGYQSPTLVSTEQSEGCFWSSRDCHSSMKEYAVFVFSKQNPQEIIIKVTILCKNEQRFQPLKIRMPVLSANVASTIFVSTNAFKIVHRLHYKS